MFRFSHEKHNKSIMFDFLISLLRFVYRLFIFRVNLIVSGMQTLQVFDINENMTEEGSEKVNKIVEELGKEEEQHDKAFHNAQKDFAEKNKMKLMDNEMQKKVDEMLLRYGVVRNQHLPELNLKGSFGLNGLGETPGQSWTEIIDGGFPSWSVGLEFRVPLGGGVLGVGVPAAARPAELVPVGRRECECECECEAEGEQETGHERNSAERRLWLEVRWRGGQEPFRGG